MEHYVEEARKLGFSKLSTMKDAHVRDMEVEKITECILNFSGRWQDVLEVGCGNGYTSKIMSSCGFTVTGIDLCEDMIEIAKERRLKNVSFEVGDVCHLRFSDKSFPIVYSERCLINLVTWRKQKKALNEIWRVLDTDGIFIMVEAFTDGLDNLNQARDAVGLPSIPMPSFNLYLEEDKLLSYLVDKFYDVNETLEKPCPPNFLSTYYFWTRVVYPALIAGRKELVTNSMFDEFFIHLPPYGNYSPIQMYVLQKL